MIHVDAVNKLLRNYEENHIEFSISYRSKSDGRLVSGIVVCTSSNYERKTANIKFINSGEIKTLRTALILSLNDIPVYL